MRTRQAAELRKYEKSFIAAPPCVRAAPTPSTPPRTRSPGFSAPTPAGVPVKIRSPGASSNQVDELRDDFRHAPDHVGDVALLARLAVHLEPDAAALGMADVDDRRDRGQRRGVIEAFRDVPGLALFLHGGLHVAAGQVVADGVAEDELTCALAGISPPTRARRPARSRGAGPRCAADTARRCRSTSRHRRAW